MKADPISIFELLSVEISGNMRRDGSYDTCEHSWGIFSTKRRAETFMKRVIDETSSYRRLFAFFIYEKIMDDCLHGKLEEFNRFKAVWSYYDDGTFYCHGDCDDACTKPFRGRPARTIMLKRGDLAWYMGYKRIYPCLVGMTPFTDAEYRRRTKELGHDMGLDCTDDSYTVYLYDHEHQHPNTWTLFPYFGKISRRHLEALLACRQHYLDDDARWKLEQAKQQQG
ncbi:MAG: hypothetical protein IJS15_13765 [Victivallales bacterium]|nr:hypothetical protein [Victivallales bacterium]